MARGGSSRAVSARAFPRGGARRRAGGNGAIYFRGALFYRRIVRARTRARGGGGISSIFFILDNGTKRGGDTRRAYRGGVKTNKFGEGW